MENRGGDSLLWGLDDLFYCHVKLLAEDIHSLLMPSEVDSVALLPPEDRPIQFVKCTGRVVSIFRLGKVRCLGFKLRRKSTGFDGCQS